MVIIISALGIYTIKNQKAKIIADTDLRMFEQVNDLSNTIKIQLQERQNKVDYALITAREVLKYNGKPTIGDRKQNVSAINQITKSTQNITISNLRIANKDVYENYIIVDKIQEMTGATATIFQKIPDGYLRISTNVLKENRDRAVDTYIPNSSPVIQTIESGNIYRGRAFVVNDYYLTAYEPIIINGKVQAILYVGLKETDLSSLKTVFKNKKYFESGYLFIIDKKGTFIIHPTKEGENYSNDDFFRQLINSNKLTGKTNYLWEGKNKFQYFKYIEQIESYVSVSIYENELLGIINKVRSAILVAIILGIIIFIIVNTQVSKSISKALKKGVDFAEKIASGDLSTSININQKDEIGLLAISLNKMAENLKVSQHKYETIFNTANDPIIIIDENGIIQNCNIRTGEIFRCSQEQILGMSVIDLSPVYQENGIETIKLGLEIISKARLGIPQSFEWIHKHINDNTSFYAEVSLKKIQLGDKTYIQSIIRDITKRKNAEGDLKRSKESLSALINATSESAFLCSIEGEIITANEIGAKRLNQRLDKIGTNVFSYFPSNNSDKRKMIGETIQKTKKPLRFEDERDGYCFDNSIYPVYGNDEEVVAYAVYAKEVTQQKKAKNALIESEAKYKAQYDYFPIPVYTIRKINGELFFTDVNNAARNYPYVKADEIIGNKVSDYFYGNEGLALIDIINDVFKSKQIRKLEISYKFKTTRIKRNLSIVVGFVPSDSVLLSTIDITDKKHAQQKVMHAMINAEERERSRIAKDLHDGASPVLAAVKLYVESLLSINDETKKIELTTKIEHTINEAIQSITEISNKLSPHILQNFGLSVAIQSFIDNISEITNLHFDFTSNVDQKLDENIEINLYRVTAELINNTIKYAKAKNILIDINIKDEEINFLFEHNGKGFNLEKKRKESKGMGLHNLFNRINSLNGKIDFNTSISNGVKVEISIPLNDL